MYKIKDYLSPLPLTNTTEIVHICAYSINCSAMLPFLEYFLYKNSGVLEFPKTEYKSQEHCNSIVSEIFRAFGKGNDGDLFVFDGIYTEIETGEKYLFYNCSEYKIECIHTFSKNDIWPSLMDEIINTGHVCNILIHNELCGFFLRNTQFIYLKDIEMPIATYVHCDSNIDFVATFGPQAINGFYVFNVEMDDERRGIRFALFLGNSLVIYDEPPPLTLPPDYDSFIHNDQWFITDHSRQYSLCTFY